MHSPLLVACCGLPGVGKSTVSAYVAEQLPAARHRSDEVRHDLFDDPEYTPAEGRRTYDELLNRTRAGLDAGEAVVVDGTFKHVDDRDRIVSVAVETGVTARFVHVTCPPAVVRDRLRSRTDDASDADVDVYRKHREQFEPLDREHVAIDNSGSLEDTYRQVDRHLLSDPD
jgi:hypothetical protein